MRRVISLAAVLLVAGCATTTHHVATPRTPAMDCEAVAARFTFANTRIASVQKVAAGQLKLPGIAQPMPEHCVVKGVMNERVGPVDHKPYAIGFEMRLPTAWNGRFFYQANGGLDGFVTPAYGDILGGGPASNGLAKGFAVISSDAGHAFDRSTPIGGATFGLDPQARLDYGYNAVAQLTPMAKSLIRAYYGKAPDTSYVVGTSNGGRHGFVAASRLPREYDGILVSTPGWRLPRAAVAQVWDAQQFARIARKNASGAPDLRTAIPQPQMDLVARSIIARCDSLDGAADGIVSDLQACQRAFDIARDVPACEREANAQCLSRDQKKVLADVMAGPRDRSGQAVYAGLAWDPAIAASNWGEWKFVSSIGPRDSIALAFVFTTPPSSPAAISGQGNSLVDYALGFDLETDLPKIFAVQPPYGESSWSFMTPPDPAFREFVAHGGKIIVFHGAADPVFSVLDTINWYAQFKAAHGPAADDHARFYVVPGMNHSRGGVATDQVDMLDPLVAWVEQGRAPQAVVAHARGAGSGVPNPEIPPAWRPNRSRPLCPYPLVARYAGQGDIEEAASFRCEK